jgi:hypothetical protein
MTNSQRDSLQWKLEADRLAKRELAAKANAHRDLLQSVSYSPDRDERIAVPDPNSYLPRSFLRKTSTLSEYSEFCDMLHTLRRFNEEFAGELTRDIECYLSISGQVRSVSDAFLDWCSRYFARRVAKSNSKDRGDSWRQYSRLLLEYDDLLGYSANLPCSIDYVFLQECTLFVQWYLVIRRDMAAEEHFALENVPLRLVRRDPPSKPEELLLEAIGTWHDHLAAFTLLLHRGASDKVVRSLLGASDASSYLNALAADIQGMRPFLVQNFNPRKTIQPVSGTTAFLAWEWCTQFGIAQIVASTSEEDVIRLTATELSQAPIVVDHSGVLRDGRKPWVTASNEHRIPEISFTGVNVVVLSTFHRTLSDFFHKIDLDRIRWLASTSIRNGTQVPEQDEDAAIALASAELAGKDSTLDSELDTK